jgi:predicted nucleic acid-binding protein
MSVSLQGDYFLDTNILVYAYDRSAGDKHTLAVKLVEECWENENGCLSIQVLQEFFVNVTRKIATPLEHQTARQIVADLAHWRLQSPDASDFLQAIDLQQSYQLSFWDAMVVQSAARLGCKQLLSEDLNHGQVYGDVQVINPFRGME